LLPRTMRNRSSACPVTREQVPVPVCPCFPCGSTADQEHPPAVFRSPAARPGFVHAPGRGTLSLQVAPMLHLCPARLCLFAAAWSQDGFARSTCSRAPGQCRSCSPPLLRT
jgi:hypothetical protein